MSTAADVRRVDAAGSSDPSRGETHVHGNVSHYAVSAESVAAYASDTSPSYSRHEASRSGASRRSTGPLEAVVESRTYVAEADYSVIPSAAESDAASASPALSGVDRVVEPADLRRRSVTDVMAEAVAESSDARTGTLAESVHVLMPTRYLEEPAAGAVSGAGVEEAHAVYRYEAKSSDPGDGAHD